MPGPAPKHPSVRARQNNPKKDFRILSAEGRTGDAPPWPLAADVSLTSTLEVQRDRMATLQVEFAVEEDGRKRGRIRRDLNKLELESAKLALQLEQAVDAEVSLWNELWTYPQSVMWEENRSHRMVASYVRWQIRNEQGDLRAASEARQLSDRLGLNDLALMKLRAEIEHVEDVEAKGRERRSQSSVKKSASRKKPGDPRAGLHAV